MSKHVWRAATIATVLVLTVLFPAFQPAHIGAAPPFPPGPTVVPGEPGQLPASIERARARQAVQEALAKYLDYWGPRYRVAPAQVDVEGEWAHAVIKWQSKAQPLEGPIHILAHRSAQGDWQALMPGSDGLYLPWVDAVPDSLVSPGEKEQLRAQAGTLRPRTFAAAPGSGPSTAPRLADAEPDPAMPAPTPTPRASQPDTWVAGETSVSRLSEDERARLCGVPAEVLEWERSQQDDPPARPAQAYDYPTTLDWRDVNGQDWTTGIRHQLSCGSCVAFGTIAAIESRLEIAAGNSVLEPDLAEAQLFYCGCVECCNVGWSVWQAMNYARDTGIADEACYPYTSQNQPCDPCSDWQSRVTRITDWSATSNLADIKQALADDGPVEVAMVIYDDFFQYTGGVYRHTWGRNVGGHAVTLVGYDDSAGYWIAKNSWGTGWGEDGWFRIAYGECEIDDYAYIPVVPAAAPQVRLYNQANYQGSVVYSGGVGFSNGPSADSYSIQIPPGWSVKTWRADNRGGEQRCWSTSVPNLQDHGWHLATESIEVYDHDVCVPCQPSADQVALFVDGHYGGSCVTKDAGAYPDAASIGLPNDTVSSLQVGANVEVVLCEHNDFAGQCETVTGDDPDLSDNSVGTDRVSSARVQPRTPSSQPDLHPFAGAGYPYPVVPSSVTGTHQADILVAGQPIYLDWHFTNSGDAAAIPTFHVELWVGDRRYVHYPTSDFAAGRVGGFDDWAATVSTPGWHTVRLVTDPGHTVQESNESNNGWERTFYWAQSAPYLDDMENGSNDWTASGLWHQVASATSPYPEVHSGAHSWWYGQDATGDYDTGAANRGELTSPPVHIPAAGYFVRFWYWYETETRGAGADRRSVQLSVDGGPFNTILQLVDDPTEWWLQGQIVDLSAYAGQTVQIRFAFDTLDRDHNNYRGWYIDDVEISTTPPPACADAREPNDTPAEAAPIAHGQTLSADICPGGDYDYYTFTGREGDPVVIDLDAKSNGSLLDSYITLLDGDGTTVLAENDDEIYIDVQDSRLGYRLPHDGTYYVKVRAWDHPSVGGIEYHYTIHLLTDHTAPLSAAITSPADDAWLDPVLATATAQAVDGETGIHRVEFMWHDADWDNSDWVWLGEDRDGRDGWSWDLDTSSLAEQRGGALRLWAYDWAGNRAEGSVINLGLDRTSPTGSVRINDGEPTTASRSVTLRLEGTDAGSGVGEVMVSHRSDLQGASWQAYAPTLDWTLAAGTGVQTVYVRYRDRAGNESAVYSDDIIAYEPVIADFTADVTHGPAPLTVHFADLSRGPVAAWAWSFGDGQTSTLQDPVHVYADSGLYEVSLTVRLAGEAAGYPWGRDTLTRRGYIATGPRTYLPMVVRRAR